MEKKVFMFFRRKDDSASARTVRSIPDEQGEVTRPVNFRKGFYRILKTSGIETKGLHSIRHPINQRKKKKKREVADLLGHTTSEITELYYVKRDMKMLNGITDGFEL